MKPLTDKPDDPVARISPSAEAFANAVSAEDMGFAGIRFELGIAIFCLDTVPGAEGVKKAFAEMVKLNQEKNIIATGEMSL